MSRWWRAYSDARHDPKIQGLPPELFRSWFNLCCLAADHEGKIKSAMDAAFALHTSESKAKAIVAQLAAKGLLDPVEGGYFEPHNWDIRQYRSDVSTNRVSKFRERQKNVDATPVETPVTVSETPDETFHKPFLKQHQIQTTDTDKKDSRAVSRETRPPMDENFEKFWLAYPRREGANPKAHALKKFVAIVKSGTDAAEIISAAGRYAAEVRAASQERTRFVAQAITWLNQQRWADYSAMSADADLAIKRGLVRVMPETPQWRAWEVSRGKTLPIDRDGGWWCPTEWPVGCEPTAAKAA